MLLQHPQVVPLTAKVLADFSFRLSKESVGTFWEWFHYAVRKKQCPALPDPQQAGEHILDKLQVLLTLQLDEPMPLVERKRTLQVADKSCLESDLAKGLLACGVLLALPDIPCPRMDQPDAMVRAIAYAQGPGADACGGAPLRAVLEKVAQCQLAEAAEVAKRFPAFRCWQGAWRRPGRLMAELPKDLRQVLEGLSFEALDESGAVLSLLQRMGMERMSLLEVARTAIQQSQQPELLAELLRANLGDALRDAKVFPSEGGQLLPPRSCSLAAVLRGFLLNPEPG